MPQDEVKDRIRGALKAYFNAADRVEVLDGFDDNFPSSGGRQRKVSWFSIVRGSRLKEKNDLIWDQLTSRLTPEEWGRITLTVGVSPDEVNGMTPEEIRSSL